MVVRLMMRASRSWLSVASKLSLGSHAHARWTLLPSAARSITTPPSLIRITDEVSDAVRHNKPVVALESTIYTHGALGKQLSWEHVHLVRSRGGVPAIIAIVNGVPTVGVSPNEIDGMIEDEGTVKASRRDIAYLTGMGLAGRKIHGGTTIAATMLLAKLAGIRIFGTGGLGGVHRDGQNSLDISADLTELGRTRVAVVCSGCKGFLDIARTLEYLETQGCLVATFADGCAGPVGFPAFWSRDSGTPSPCVVENPEQAAAMILAQERLAIESGILFANPVPRQYAVPSDDMASAIDQAVREAASQGFSGNRNTPYVLGRVKQLVGDKAVAANKALVAANIAQATDIALHLSRIVCQSSVPMSSLSAEDSKNAGAKRDRPEAHDASQVDMLVAGAVALDLHCDYTGTGPNAIQPAPHTSNPARISQSVGGVGHNVALAAHLSSSQVRVRLCSIVGDDVAASTVLSSMEAVGLSTETVQRLSQVSNPGSRTAQYVSVNDGAKNLVMAMADMEIFTKHSASVDCDSVMATTRPKWLVVDGNWSAAQLMSWIRAAEALETKVAFEPVSAEKSKSVHFASPNTYELAAMNYAARENGYLESDAWFRIIDSLGMKGARDKFVRLTSHDLADAGVPVQSVQLLPYIPTLVTKLGPKGVLLTALLAPGHPLLQDNDSRQYILARAHQDAVVGGVYMRLFPALKMMQEAVSVNGAGDTLVGVLMSGLVQGGSVEKLVDIAQKGAVFSLMHPGSVSPRVRELDEELSRSISRQQK